VNKTVLQKILCPDVCKSIGQRLECQRLVKLSVSLIFWLCNGDTISQLYGNLTQCPLPLRNGCSSFSGNPLHPEIEHVEDPSSVGNATRRLSTLGHGDSRIQWNSCREYFPDCRGSPKKTVHRPQSLRQLALSPLHRMFLSL
jgi:hypothetical protein